MTSTSNISESHPIFWISDNDSTLSQVSALANGSSQFVLRIGFENANISHFKSMEPCRLVVIEFPKSTDQALVQSRINDLSSSLELIKKYETHPVILVLGHEIPAEQVVRWMKLGISGYAEATKDSSALLHIIREQQEQAKEKLARFRTFIELKNAWDSITNMEHQVLLHMFEGTPNKSIAAKIGVSQRTVEARRQRIFQKLNAASLPIAVKRKYDWEILRTEFDVVDNDLSINIEVKAFEPKQSNCDDATCSDLCV